MQSVQYSLFSDIILNMTFSEEDKPAVHLQWMESDLLLAD